MNLGTRVRTEGQQADPGGPHEALWRWDLQELLCEIKW